MIATRFLADEDALRVAARAIEHGIRNESIVKNDVGLLKQLNCAKREQIRIAGAGTDQIHLADAVVRRRFGVVSPPTRSENFALASFSSPASTREPTMPPIIRSQKRPTLLPGASARFTSLRRSPTKRARAPSRAGSNASICCRTRRASTGELPPEPTATTTGERSIIAGKMNVDSSGSSTTLISSRRAFACRRHRRIHFARIGSRNNE